MTWLEVGFKEFIDAREKERERRTYTPTYYQFKEDCYFLYIRTFHGWNLFTKILLSSIYDFAASYGGDPEQAVIDWENNYLAGAKPIISHLSPDQIERLYDVPVIIEDPSLVTKAASDEITPITMREEASEYETFYLSIVKDWEREVISAIDTLPTHKSFGEINKTFGEFLSRVMNNINTTPFVTGLQGIIRRIMLSGLASAEEELGMDIGVGPAFTNKLEGLLQQQLDGYTVNGKRWHGIKGATSELQKKIFVSVSNDVKNKASKAEMTAHIKELFSGATTAQAKRIANTESHRFIGESRLAAFKDTGLDLLKTWRAVNPCDICTRLENKYSEGIPLDEPFVDEITGWKGQIAGPHPNCKCLSEAKVPKK